MLVVTVQVDKPCDTVEKNGILILVHIFKHQPDERGNLQYMTTIPMNEQQADELAMYGTIGRRNMNSDEIALYKEYMNDQYNKFKKDNQNNNSEL